MKLALGTVQFGIPYGIANQRGQVGVEEAQAIVRYAESSGFDTLDTAIGYGESEQRLGEIGVQGWRVVSKLPDLPDDCPDVEQWVVDSIHASMQRLGVRQLWGVLVHRPDQLLGAYGETLYAALSRLKDDGVVRKVGVSIYTPDELGVLCARFGFDIIQAPLNVIDRRLIESGWLDRLSRQGTEVHVRSVFLQGLLLLSPANRPEKFSRWNPLWGRWQQWLSDTCLTPLQACLRFALMHQQVDRVIVGVDSLRHIQEILLAAAGDLPELPPGLHCDDFELVNPTNWRSL
jgi:aryl-alcohol dehydrogenase-like predicted oxidoreductase